MSIVILEQGWSMSLFQLGNAQNLRDRYESYAETLGMFVHEAFYITRDCRCAFVENRVAGSMVALISSDITRQ
jgi:hypothetical protein